MRPTVFSVKRCTADARRSRLDLSPETERRVDVISLNWVGVNVLNVDEVIESRVGDRIAGDAIALLSDAFTEESRYITD